MDKRRITQLFATLASNSNLNGFLNGSIYKGASKKICVPGLNCYSCPGAIGSCPIGSLQAVIGTIKYNFSFYVSGMVLLFGVIFGRFICGWLCPFGFFQDLLYKIPTSKIKVSNMVNNVFKYFKYLILLIFVIILPLFLVNEFGTSPPYFCQFICPVGTLQGGIPLLFMNQSLRGAIGFLFIWKVFILITIIVASILVYRLFCRYLCPLGAFYSLFNKISFYRYKLEKDKCTSCKACKRQCKLNIDVYKTPNSGECIRCGECIKVCPTKSIYKETYFGIDISREIPNKGISK